MEQPVGRRRRAGISLRRTLATGAALAVVAGPATASAAGQYSSNAGSAGGKVNLIVEAPGALGDVEQSAVALGGTVTGEFPEIGAFAITLPPSARPALAAVAGVTEVINDLPITLASLPSAPAPGDLPGAPIYNETVMGARQLWDQGSTGSGVTVALVDTGVIPAQGLNSPGKVILGPDFSSEASDPQRAQWDTFGHGTHMGGIIAGRDPGTAADPSNDSTGFLGVAPDASLLSVKVAGADGSTSVSTVIKAMQWVDQHKTDNGMKVKVLNLSFSAAPMSDYRNDPLAQEAEQLHGDGVVVVAAAGNHGAGSNGLTSPAYDPVVIAVGSSDTQGTTTLSDDVVSTFSNAGDGNRNPDLVAPGRSVVSLRDPGSTADVNFPSAVVGQRFFKGSGTSQATAMVSGAVALLQDAHPWWSPDRVRSALDSTAAPFGDRNQATQGAGLINVQAAAASSASSVSASAGRASGSTVTWREYAHEPATTAGSSWSGSSWSRSSWSGSSWSGSSWSSSSWSGSSWSGSSWSSSSWSGSSWS